MTKKVTFEKFLISLFIGIIAAFTCIVFLGGAIATPLEDLNTRHLLVEFLAITGITTWHFFTEK